jgi:hypothetical protein
MGEVKPATEDVSEHLLYEQQTNSRHLHVFFCCVVIVGVSKYFCLVDQVFDMEIGGIKVVARVEFWRRECFGFADTTGVCTTLSCFREKTGEYSTTVHEFQLGSEVFPVVGIGPTEVIASVVVDRGPMPGC